MSSAERHYVVFSCSACGARIFAEAEQVGKTGLCPACHQSTIVAPRDPKRVSGPQKAIPGSSSGSSSQRRGQERRKTRRITVPDSKVAVEGKGSAGRPVSASELAELMDISEGGIGYVAVGERDRKKLTGFGPPAVKIGDTISVTLHVPALFRPRMVKAVVRRVEPHPTRKELWKVGCEFTALTDDARVDLKKLIESRPTEWRG